jgi:hypothetical protein
MYNYKEQHKLIKELLQILELPSEHVFKFSLNFEVNNLAKCEYGFYLQNEVLDTVVKAFRKYNIKIEAVDSDDKD